MKWSLGPGNLTPGLPHKRRNAINLIYQTSRGYPRAANNLALEALIAAFADSKGIVDESSTRAAIAEVMAE